MISNFVPLSLHLTLQLIELRLQNKFKTTLYIRIYTDDNTHTLIIIYTTFEISLGEESKFVGTIRAPKIYSQAMIPSPHKNEVPKNEPLFGHGNVLFAFHHKFSPALQPWNSEILKKHQWHFPGVLKYYIQQLRFLTFRQLKSKSSCCLLPSRYLRKYNPLLQRRIRVRWTSYLGFLCLSRFLVTFFRLSLGRIDRVNVRFIAEVWEKFELCCTKLRII